MRFMLLISVALTPDLLWLVFLWMFGNVLRWSHTHLCRFKGLQTAPHGPLEDLLHLTFILVDIQTAPTVLVAML